MNLESQLFTASINNDFERIKILIEANRDKLTNYNYTYILGWSIHNKNFQTVQYIVENKVPLGTPSESINTSLEVASDKGFLEFVQYLVENGANVNSNNGFSLQQASTNGHLEIVRFLVENGANIKNNPRIVRWASLMGHFEIVKYLVENGADIKECQKDHKEAILESRFWKKWRTFKIRQWASRLLKVFYSPDSVLGKRDREKFKNELF